MAASPVIVISVIVLTLGFEALVFGDSIYPNLTPNPPPIDFGGCSFNPGAIPLLGSIIGGIAYIGCLLANVVNLIATIAVFLINTVAFIFLLITFQVPGAPILVRFIVGSFITLSLGWSVATLMRGN